MILALLCRRLVRISLAFLASFLFFLLTLPLSAQSDDPSEIFLKAYLSAQQGEKLEHENRFKTALAKFRFAGSLIEELRRSHPDWQPAIVEYRGRRIGEGILRVQERISRQNDLNAAARPLPEVVPSLPENDAWSEPGPEVVAPKRLDANSLGSSDPAIEEATRKLRQKVDHLQAALEESRGDLDTARKENEAVNARLQETSSKLADAQKEIGASKESERQASNQLAQAEASQGNSAAEQLRAQIADLKNEVAIAKEARAATEKQRDKGKAKLAEVNEQVAVAGQQRDQALPRLKTGSEMHQHSQTLLAGNADLKQQPATAEKTAIDNDNSTNADELMTAKQQVTQLQQQLAESHKENQYLVARIGELSVQLDETGAQLQSAKLVGNNGGETDRLMRENELLRNIVVRERQQEARRDEARKLMLAELDKLKIKSDALNQEIELLSQPVTKLSSEELSPLRQPVLSVSGQNRDLLTAGFIFAKKSAQDLFEGEAATNQFRLNGDAGGDPQSVGHADANQSSDGATTGPQEPMSGSPDPGSE